MKIGIASDHGGYELKEQLRKRLLAQNDIQILDFGTYSSSNVDYPDFAAQVAQRVSNGALDRGILICGTGIGMSIVANKFPGVRAALVHDLATAILAAKHNKANILALGGRILDSELAWKLVEAWLTTSFEDRHSKRISKIDKIEQQTMRRRKR